MPKTITLDKVDIQRLTLLKDANGDLQVYAEYSVKAGSLVVNTKMEAVQQRLSGARRAAAQALFDAISQDVSAAELA